MLRPAALLPLLLLSGALAAPSGPAKDLLDAAAAGDTAKVAAALEAGAEVDSQDDNGQTALLYAAGVGKDAVVPALLAAGANVDHTDTHSWSASMLASMYGHADVLKQLIDAGADLTKRTKVGRGALDLAKSKGKADCVALLEAALQPKARPRRPSAPLALPGPSAADGSLPLQADL